MEKVTFEQRAEGDEEGATWLFWGEAFQAKWTTHAKNLVTGNVLGCLRSSKKASMFEAEWLKAGRKKKGSQVENMGHVVLGLQGHYEPFTLGVMGKILGRFKQRNHVTLFSFYNFFFFFFFFEGCTYGMWKFPG